MEGRQKAQNIVQELHCCSVTVWYFSYGVLKNQGLYLKHFLMKFLSDNDGIT